jgi:predicted nucleotide-binding protein
MARARRPVPGTVAGSLPPLRIPAAEARQKLQAQIDQGQELPQLLQMAGGWPRPGQGEPAEYTRWNQYNLTLLDRLFSGPTPQYEYNETVRLGVEPVLGGSAVDYGETAKARIVVLQSLLDRLDLCEEAGDERNATEQGVERVHSREVFVVHGRDEGRKQAVARVLEKLGLDVVILHERPSKGRTIIEKFEDYSDVGYAVVLLAGDDVGALASERDKLHPRPRQNVIFELGYFVGRLGRKGVCALYEEGVEIPSDYKGVVYVPLDAAEGSKLRLALELSASGFDIDFNKLA